MLRPGAGFTEGPLERTLDFFVASDDFGEPTHDREDHFHDWGNSSDGLGEPRNENVARGRGVEDDFDDLEEISMTTNDRSMTIQSVFATNKTSRWPATLGLMTAVSGLLLFNTPAFAQVLRLARSTDTIRVPLQTNFSTHATFEVRILVPVGNTSRGRPINPHSSNPLSYEPRIEVSGPIQFSRSEPKPLS